MNQILIINREVGKFRLNIKNYKTVYSSQTVINKVRPSIIGKLQIIPEDFFLAIDHLQAVHEACQLIDKIYDQMISHKNISPLSEIGGPKYAQFLTKKSLLRDIIKICRAFWYVDKIIKQYNIKGNVDFIPGYFSFKVYQILRNSGLLPDNIEIPKIYLSQMKIWEIAKSLFFMMKLIAYPESLFFRMNGKKEKNDVINRFKYGVHVHNGRGFNKKIGSMDFLIDEKTIKNEDVLFVFDEQPIPHEFIKEAEKRGYNFVNFYGDMLKKFNLLKYIKKYYYHAVKVRIKFAALCMKNPLLTSLCFHTLREFLLWNLFYDGYSVKIFIAMQHPGNLTRIIINRKHGAENIFSHSSVVYDRLNRKSEESKNRAEQFDYSYLLFDKAFSDKLSNEWLKNSGNNIKEFCNVGSIYSDIVFEVNNFHKNGIKNRLEIPDNKKLISFFDGTVGHTGTLNFREEYLLIKSAMDLLNANEDYFVIFKFKKPLATVISSVDYYIVKEFEALFKHPRCICANKADITNFELMGISDLLISTPLSSVIFESVIGGIKTICYDPSGRYNQDHYIINKFPNFIAHSYEELLKSIDYWLNECGEKEFNEFLNNYIKKYADDYCDGRAIERFRELLALS